MAKFYLLSVFLTALFPTIPFLGIIASILISSVLGDPLSDDIVTTVAGTVLVLLHKKHKYAIVANVLLHLLIFTTRWTVITQSFVIYMSLLIQWYLLRYGFRIAL
jgi:ABC-type enterochelin transport system permease subunit